MTMVARTTAVRKARKNSRFAFFTADFHGKTRKKIILFLLSGQTLSGQAVYLWCAQTRFVRIAWRMAVFEGASDALANALESRSSHGSESNTPGVWQRIVTFIQRLVFLQCGDQPIKFETKEVCTAKHPAC